MTLREVLQNTGMEQRVILYRDIEGYEFKEFFNGHSHSPVWFLRYLRDDTLDEKVSYIGATKRPDGAIALLIAVEEGYDEDEDDE